MGRDYDVILYGATGFTGQLTAEYLAEHGPAGLRWAIAGRNRSKLEALRDRLTERFPTCADLPVLQADSSDAPSLQQLAESTKVIMSGVGPFVTYGEPMVAACAAAGTDYTDITGEPEFFDRMYVRHHRLAEQTGARIVHACGIDSIPQDLGAQFCVEQLPEGVPLTVRGYLTGGGAITPSGGTLGTLLEIGPRWRQAIAAAKERKRLQPPVTGRRISAPFGRLRKVREAGFWGVPAPLLDPLIVKQSARSLDRYGPDFTYEHHLGVKRLPVVALGAVAVTALGIAIQIPPVRRWLATKRVSGEGPSAEQRAKSWFSVHFIGEGGGRWVHTEVAGGDPGYGETAKMFAEAALCLAFDDLPPTAGQVTTAAAMGPALRDRLVKAGLVFQVLGERAV